MTNKRIYDLTENSSPAAGDYLVVDKSGNVEAQKVNVNKFQLADATLTALAALDASAGILVQNSADVFVKRTISGTSNEITVTDSGTNLGFSIPATVDLGGKTSVEIPNGAGGTTLDAAGEVCVDTTSKTLNFYSDAEYVLHPQRSKSFLLETPATTDDLPIHRFDQAVTLTKVVYAIKDGTNWVGQLQEANDAQGTGAADTQAADSTVTSTTTVTSFSNASFDAGDYLYLKTTSVSGSVSWLHVTFYYRINP